ncbi:hypothetical protein QAD02_017004 [Eretmocerus hayati]|uniref:Uncharacterized protein n=1 Tax=Eretmocerus hayati TaxID=131215 RepID=A0ACC2PD21_9HYME|nr:hypothetical protein QAD02_017004 [Eretmocerus hayati]
MKPTASFESTKKNCATTNNQHVEWDHLDGDGLILRIKENKGKLWISGNGCQVSLRRNCGSVRVTGDGCQVFVSLNSGNVEYDGDGGQVVLGPDSTSFKVKYTGDGGSVTVRDSRSDKKNTSAQKCSEGEIKKSEKNKSNTRTNNNTTTTRTVVSNGKMVVTRRNLDESGKVLSTKIVTSDCKSDPNGNSVVEMKTSVEMGLLRGINVSVTNCI